MPRLSQFYGIAIYMYYRDHAPPHVHAIYGDDEAVFSIEDGLITDGNISRRAGRLVSEWIELYRSELESNWAAAVSGQPMRPIPPLP